MRFVVIDSCPCPRPLFPILKKLKHDTGCEYDSIYRGDDALGLLHANNKHSQRELAEATAAERAAWGILGTPNPPDRGTHILLGDGVVGHLHEKLPWFKCGIDINLKGSEAEQEAEARRIEAAARRHGWELYRPYSSGSERHHFNFRKKPSRWKAFFRNIFGGHKPSKHKAPATPIKPTPHHEPRVKVTKTKTGHEASLTIPSKSGGVIAPKPKKDPTNAAKKADHLGNAIDVSEAQGSVDWKKVATKVKVAFAKATEGHDFTDPTFTAARVKAMLAAKLRVGFYHFARPDNGNSPSAEARHFIKTVHAAGGKFISYEDWKAGKPGVLGILDFETAPYSRQRAAAWGKTFEKETGVKAMLYGYGDSLNPVLGAVRHFACIWFAAYVPDWKPYLDGHQDRVRFWQISDKWSCPGVKGNVDHSRYLG